MIGDGYCNDEANTFDCGFDGGDCCGTCVNTDLCTTCSCLSNITGDGVPNALVGNGYCNDETNNVECGYDHGDCCLPNVMTDYCTNCTCLLFEACATGSLPPSVGDGYCNDETNIIECGYDHGDCCLTNVITDYCSNCSCSSIGVITSPGFPGNYDNNLDLTWIIQLPPGHLIEIVFLNIQIESGYVFFLEFLRLQFLLSNLFKF